MVSKLKQRLASDEGFTLIELLVVIVILGILLAIAVPSYLGFKDRADQTAAKSNIRAAFPSAEAYFSDVGSYTGMALAAGAAPDTSGLTGIDGGIKVNTVTVGAGGTTYAVCAISGSYKAVGTGPDHTITVTKSAAPTCP